MFTSPSKQNSIRELIQKKEEKLILSSLKSQNTQKVNYLRQNSGDVCRLCQNNPKEESFRSSLITQNVSILKNNLIPLFFKKNHNYELNFEFFQAPDSENKIIQPCNCLIPVHTKCLLKLILFSQNLCCPNCNSIIKLKRTKKKSYLQKCFSFKFLLQNFYFLFIILLTLFAVIVLFYVKFTDKFFHIKILIIIFLIFLEILCLIKYFEFLRKIKNFPLSEKLSFVEKKYENEVIDSQAAIPLYVSSNKDSYLGVNNLLIKNTAKDKNSKSKTLEIFSLFLKVNFKISSIEILEYKNERNLKTKIDQEVKKSFLEKIENFSKEKFHSKLKISQFQNINSNTYNSHKESQSCRNSLQNNLGERDSIKEIESEKIKSSRRHNPNDVSNHTNGSQLNKEKHTPNFISPVTKRITPKSSDVTIHNKNDANMLTLSIKDSTKPNSNPIKERFAGIEVEDFEDIENNRWNAHNTHEKKNVKFEADKNSDHITNHMQGNKHIEHKAHTLTPGQYIGTPINTNDSNYSINSNAQQENEFSHNLHKHMLQMKYTNLSMKKIEEMDSVMYPEDDKSRITAKNFGTVKPYIAKNDIIFESQLSLSDNSPSNVNGVKSGSISISNVNNFFEDNLSATNSNNGHTFSRGLDDVRKNSDDLTINDNFSQYSKFPFKTISQLSPKNESISRGSFLTTSNNMFDNGINSSQTSKQRFSTQSVREYNLNLSIPKRQNNKHITYNYHKNKNYMENFSILKHNKLKKLELKRLKISDNGDLSNPGSVIQAQDNNNFDLDHFYKKKKMNDEKNSEGDDMITKDFKLNTEESG